MPVVNLTQGSPEWLAWRAKGGPDNPFPAGVGASDAPIILGLSQHRDEGDLWREKAGAEGPQPTSYVMAQGHHRERGVLAAYQNSQGDLCAAITPLCIEHDEHPAILASLDGSDLEAGIIQEVKLRGAEEYQLARQGRISLSTWVQVQHQLAVVASLNRQGSTWLTAHVLVVAPQVENAEFALVVVEPCPTFQAALLDAELDYLWSLKDGKAPNGQRAPLGVQLMRLHSTGYLDPAEAWPATQTGGGFTECQPGASLGEGEGFSVPSTSAPAADVLAFQVPTQEAPAVDQAPAPAAIVPASAVVVAPTVREEAQSLTIAEGWVATRDGWIERAATLTVTDKDAADRAGLLIKEVGTHRRALDEARKKLTEPYRKAEDTVNAKVREYLAPLEEAEDSLKAKVKAWTIAEEKRQREEAERLRREREEYERKVREAAAEQARLEAEATAKGQAPPPPPAVLAQPAPEAPAPKPKGKTAVAGVRRRKRVCIEIKDPQAVPRDLCRPDPALCQALAEARINKDTATVGERFTIAPGIEAWVELEVGGGR